VFSPLGSPTTPERRFPPPCSAEVTPNCFIVRAAHGQALSYIYYQSELGRRSAAKLLKQRWGTTHRGEHRQAARPLTTVNLERLKKRRDLFKSRRHSLDIAPPVLAASGFNQIPLIERGRQCCPCEMAQDEAAAHIAKLPDFVAALPSRGPS
jgi:hypothetical protein